MKSLVWLALVVACATPTSTAPKPDFDLDPSADFLMFIDGNRVVATAHNWVPDSISIWINTQPLKTCYSTQQCIGRQHFVGGATYTAYSKAFSTSGNLETTIVFTTPTKGKGN